jgi:hypothetical protein
METVVPLKELEGNPDRDRSIPAFIFRNGKIENAASIFGGTKAYVSNHCL